MVFDQPDNVDTQWAISDSHPMFVIFFQSMHPDSAHAVSGVGTGYPVPVYQNPEHAAVTQSG